MSEAGRESQEPSLTSSIFLRLKMLSFVLVPCLVAFAIAQSTNNTQWPKGDCSAFAKSLQLQYMNAKVLRAQFYPFGSIVDIGGEQARYCINETAALADICRITFDIATSARSSAYAEIWLPVTDKKKPWSGRMMNTGNPGFSGCIEYENVAYATSLGFAAVGDNGGHDGGLENGTAFLNNKDAVIDFSYRARHASVQLGKEVSRQYYGQRVKKAYHFGCSNVGRQGLKMAQMYPDDFDGILAGAPALDWNHLTSWGGHFLTLTGSDASDPRFLTHDQWELVHNEVLNQCDKIDGVADGIIEDSTICAFNPEYLLCGRSRPGGNNTCLSQIQTQTARAVFSPLYGLNNTFLFPRLSPGAELSAATPVLFPYLTGDSDNLGSTWYRNAIYNDPSLDAKSLNPLDYAYADSLDPVNGHISSFSTDLTSYKSKGGKILTYHGGADAIIPDGISLRYYRLVASTMKLAPKKMDNFYRLFTISGMDHCLLGPGAWAFGQENPARAARYNIVMALVDWVENNKAPDRVTGTKWKNDNASAAVVEIERAHCRYPYRTTYKGHGDPTKAESWDCKFIDDWNVCGGPSDRLPQLC